MLRIIHSIPEQCPDCGSDNLSGKQMVLFEASNTLLCECGVMLVLQDDYEEEPEEEVSASFLSCPHCRTVNEIQIAEGDEWCGGCGMDPNRLDYPPEELAHLWKEGSGIRDTMERGVPKSTMARIYRFLTNFCGPHCSFAESCPQSTGNFAICYREEVLEGKDPDLLYIGETDVGKKKKNRKARKKEKERIRKEKEKAVLKCSASGWYAQNLKPKHEVENL